MNQGKVIVVGSGFGSLSCAALLAKEGLDVTILEQNYLPGGCTSSYWRKGFVFEAGATTLVGLDRDMPLRYLVDQLGIKIKVRRLELPMQVHLRDGQILRRHENLGKWIDEAESRFSGNQRQFWEKCFEVSQFVWNSSTRYKQFPPSALNDFVDLTRNFDPRDLQNARYALISTQKMMQKYGVDSKDFKDFVNEQLLITAQNNAEEVNFLFGAAALCYTNYGNYYVDGGLINLVEPFIRFIEQHGGKIHYRTGVKHITAKGSKYQIETTKGSFEADYVISGLPANNTREIFQTANLPTSRIMTSKQLNGAFQMGIGFKSTKKFESLHHQIHLQQPLVETGSKSIFVSLDHELDSSRSDLPGHRVASISTHVADPANSILDGARLEEAVVAILEERGFLNSSDIVYQHSSSPRSWHKWTRRAWGFVGGYPQYLSIKPWQMLDARLDKKRAYICGDTVYPGQGIPGTALSGIIAAQKLKADWL